MNRFLLIILLFIIISFILIRISKLQEHFESESEDNKDNKSVEDILGDLDIDLDKYTSRDGEIQFSDLPLDKLDNTAMDSILDKIGSHTRKTVVSGKEVEQTNEVKIDIERANLLRREIMKRKLLKNKAVEYEALKNKHKKLESYSRGELNTLVNKCYLQEHAYNASPDVNKYSLEYTSHPIKWYGIETRIKNVFPANYAFV